ncbi:MAG: type II toxin-antitoxin system HipA family toxin [Longimicrobiales bacterium]|nr:type II toxin-antitoxin system HipA family toxin [Longimicrobiales bacterium]
MSRTIAVHVGSRGDLVGHLRYNREGSRESASFEYDPGWLESSGGFAIDPALLRLVRGPQFHKRMHRDDTVFHGAIADTEPDGWGKRVILRDHAKRRAEGRATIARSGEPLNRLDFLLAVDDQSRVGALRFRDESGEFQRAPAPEGRRTPPSVSLAQLVASSHAVEMDQETMADLDYLRGRGTSLGGLRPKCSIVTPDGHLAIGKFPSVEDQRAVTKGEVLAMRIAQDAGVRTAEASLVETGGLAVAVVRRFDRDGASRIPYISAATLLGVSPRDPEPHSYMEIVDALRTHGDNVAHEAEELWRRVALSILITNLDDHLLNHGFLHRGHGRWALSPAFDINPFPDRVRELKTWISESSGPAASLDLLLEAAPYFQVKPARAREIVGEVDRAVSTWRIRGREIGMSNAELDHFADAFEHAEREVARRIEARRGP